MLFKPDPVIERRREVLRKVQAGTISDAEGGRELLDIDPDYGPACLLMSKSLSQAGKQAEAEEWLWKGLALQPCESIYYLSLKDACFARSAPLADGLFELALWKLALAPEVPSGVSRLIRETLPHSASKYDQPEDFEVLALVAEAGRKKKKEPAEVTARLLPYRLLNELQRQAPYDVDDNLLDEILKNGAECVPLFRAALAEWADNEDALSEKSTELIIALLGELAGPELLPELLELSAYADPIIFLHANWAIACVEKRFPSEALAAFQAAAQSADLSRRCAIAEHLALLPAASRIPDIAQTLVGGFQTFADESDASHLLLALRFALVRHGLQKEAEAMMRQYEPLLPAGERLEREADFQPVLLKEELDALTIADVVLGRALMDDEGEEDDDLEDYEEDYIPEPVVVQPKPGRNEPCWCGSGKKYKKCHLASDQESDRSGPPPHAPAAQAAHGGGTVHVLEQMLQLAEQRYGPDEARQAVKKFFGAKSGNIKPGTMGDEQFLDWYVRDFRPRPSEPTIAEIYVRERAARWSTRERTAFEAWRNSRFGLYEVVGVEEGKGTHLSNVFERGRFFIRDMSTSRSLVRGDYILARVENLDGTHQFGGNILAVPRNLAGELEKSIEQRSREAGEAPARFTASNVPWVYREMNAISKRFRDNLTIVTAEGDTFEFCSATYEVLDEAALLEAFRAEGQLEDVSGDKPAQFDFTWLSPAGEKSRRVYGNIRIAKGRLKLESQSRERLMQGRALIERIAGSRLKHLGDSIESVKSAMRRMEAEGPPKRDSGVSPEVERQLIAEFKEQYYERWTEEPVPALGGKTPREAAETYEGRRALRALLRDLEHDEEHERKAGRAAVDVSRIRERLNLEDE